MKKEEELDRSSAAGGREGWDPVGRAGDEREPVGGGSLDDDAYRRNPDPPPSAAPWPSGSTRADGEMIIIPDSLISIATARRRMNLMRIVNLPRRRRTMGDLGLGFGTEIEPFFLSLFVLVLGRKGEKSMWKEPNEWGF